MQVVFKTHLGQTLDGNFNTDCSVRILKQHVSKLLDVDILDIILYYNTFILKDNWSLEEIQYKSGSAIFVRVYKRSVVTDDLVPKILESTFVDKPDKGPTNVELLVCMGFTEDQARAALKLYVDINQAAEYLLTSKEKIPEPSPPPKQQDPPRRKRRRQKAFLDREEVVNILLDEFQNSDPAIIAAIYDQYEDMDICRTTLQAMGFT